MTRDANTVVPLPPAVDSALLLTGLLTAIAVVLATVQRLSAPVWLPAVAALAAVLASAGWCAGGRRRATTVPIEPLPDLANVISPRASAGRRALRIAYALPVVVFLGAVRRHTTVTDMALTVAVSAWCGWLVAQTWMLSRRVRRAEASLKRPRFAAAGPFEGCRGRNRIFAAPAES